ncbi:hypothetical protein ALC56_11949 [Trachymyrmex septentrionalis]|uniref:FYVE-type zinc finger domain-containing protein n=1 Tax=Trachymyrmex septentrionalis TaxID=34720 RepID=A0A195F0L0_9HYME|nr:hypothetical protein ALC56_11949 [Trachymyrmex septentrionalis]
MLMYVSTLISTLLIESDKVVPGQERYNMATFMVLFLLITIEVVVVKVVTASDMEPDEDSHSMSAAAVKNSKVKETKRVVFDRRCACCLASFLIDRGVRCSDCGARSCRKACSRWDTSDNAWHCIFCHQQRSWLKRNDNWFDNFGSMANEEEELHSVFATAKSHLYVAENAAAISNVEQIQEDWEERRMVYAIQNFVEKIVDGFVENINDTPIDRLYENLEYDRFLEEHRPPLIAALIRLTTCLKASLTNKSSTDSPTMAHAALREIVEKAVEEARKLPELNASEDTEQLQEERAVTDDSYEDLLATAILNKVIEKYQRERVDGNSNVLHDTNSPKAKYTANDSKHSLEEDVASYASDHLECNGDHSASIRRNEDHKPVSFTMEERIEEVTTITSDDDELRDNGVLEFGCSRRVPFPEYGIDIIDPPRELPSPSPSSSSDSSDLNRNEYLPVRTKRHAIGHTMDIVSPIESWEDNWLFQKKRNSRSQPDAVAMLVPSSNAYYKALIGDRDAEDTSDLSECSSTKSDEEIEKELMEAINNVIPRTPRISESDATNDQIEKHQKGTSRTQFEKDKVDTCQAIKKTEKNATVCESYDEKNDEEHLKTSEKKTAKREDDKEKRNESSFMLITVATEDDEAKEKPKDTVECSKEITAIVVESSVQKEVKMKSEKSSERSDRGENVADENEEQRESEYTEHYDTAIQRHLDSLTKIEVCSGESETIDGTRKMTDEQLRKLEINSIEQPKSEHSEAEVHQLSYATIDKNHVDMISENDPLSTPPRPGTIAEREHKKWENAPPIENNPYSEESIRKRCLERQYSRNSDISGAHYELTKLNEVSLETLTPGRPDIKRFGRDYYINQSKVASGERQERTRSAMSSMSSRPSSSLSQQSSCAGDEQHERQVSHDELKQFEAASLRGSLPRRCCRDPLASPHFAINPLLHLDYVLAESLDHDSGMCSIGSRDSESSERDRWRQLFRLTDNPDGNGQISSIGGRRFWTTGGYKYHTFGGIRIRPKKEENPDDFEDESTSPEDSFEDRSPEFAKLKFQTFGGIKRSRKIDSRRIPNYRKIRLRPILPEASVVLGRDLVEKEGLMNLKLYSNINSGNCDQPTNWNRSDEKNDVTNNRISMGYPQIGRSRNRTSTSRINSMTKRKAVIRKKNINSSSLWSLPNEDDEWQDEIDCASDEIIMNKFLKNVSRRRKASVFNNDNIVARGRERSGRHREILEDDNSEKLKKSIIRNTERDLKNSKESQKEENDHNKTRRKKLYSILHMFQEERLPMSKETDDSISILQEEKDTKMPASWRKNNAEIISLETNNHAMNSRVPVDRQKVKNEKDTPDETMWKDRQQTDDILENQRKNNKNEINAKLNNQEQSIEAEHKDDKERKVRKIDLKAYGFENEFSDKKKPQQIGQQRMVNRLDLSSFGYQNGLRRAHSNNQLDQPLRNNDKSNLIKHGYKEYMIDTPRSFGCKDFAKSSRGLNELRDEVEEVNSRLISVKSMPNVAEDVCYHANPVYVNDTQDELTAINLLDYVRERDVIIEDDISLNDYDEISSDVERSFEDIYIMTKAQSRETNEELRVMPSVKRLAEVFGRRQTSEKTAMPAKVYRASVAKVDDAKDRSVTPEVQIVETPRQMHSLTARSLSREFREGLRQMPGKLTSLPVSRSLIEERPTNRTEIVRSKQETNDTAVISPGKLKSNIIFWEQMQKRS